MKLLSNTVSILFCIPTVSATQSAGKLKKIAEVSIPSFFTVFKKQYTLFCSPHRIWNCKIGLTDKWSGNTYSGREKVLVSKVTVNPVDKYLK